MTQNKEVNNDLKQKLPVWVWAVIGVLVLLVIILFISNGSNSNNSSSTGKSGVTDYNGKTSEIEEKEDKTEKNKKKIYGYNETFAFDNLEITIGENYKFDTVKNHYSDYNGKTVVGLPITIKNLSEETHSLNMFYYDVFGSAGTEVKTLNSYFDDNLDDAGELRYNASYTKYTYFLYDGNGTYSLEFDNYSEKILVEIEINK